MKFPIACALLLVILLSRAGAETIEVDFTEPADQAGTLLETRVYSCCTNNNSVSVCKEWQLKLTFPSDDGNGGDAKNGTYNVPIREDELPKTCRTAFTSVNTPDLNETNPNAVTQSDTFTAP
jgi:hypothetical protein